LQQETRPIYSSFENLRERIKNAVLAKGDSLSVISENIGVDRNTIRGIMDGKINDPGIRKILKLLEYLKMDSTIFANKISSEGNLEKVLELLKFEASLSEDKKELAISFLKNIAYDQSYSINRILLVDDQEVFLQAIEKYFLDRNFEIKTATGYDRAIPILSSFKPQVALLDIDLKDSKNGLDLLEYIIKNHPETKCIMLTGHRDNKMAHQALAQGAFDYVVKDEDLEKLFFVVSKIEEYKKLDQKNKELKSLIQR
jgi:ActR/RegA family two-component response regulator